MWPLWHKIMALVMVVIGVLGWFGNGLVVYIFLLTPNLRTPSNVFVINLAFSDFLMMFAMSPPMVINCWFETWVLGKKLESKKLIISIKMCFFFFFNIETKHFF